MPLPLCCPLRPSRTPSGTTGPSRTGAITSAMSPSPKTPAASASAPASWPDFGAIAVSKDMLVEQFQAFASEMLMDPVHELVSRQGPIRLDDRPLAVQPPRLDRVEPGAFHRQPTHQDPAPAGALHRLVMRPDLRLHRSTDVPGGVV